MNKCFQVFPLLSRFLPPKQTTHTPCNYISLMAQTLIPSASLTNSSSIDLPRTSSATSTIFGPKLELGEIEHTYFRLLKPNSSLRLKASREPLGLTQEFSKTDKSIAGAGNGGDLFNNMKHRFLSFKKNNYLENIERYQSLAKSQAPKFMVVACADSRVCPSSILGFQPGDAFVIRNVANLVPPFENGPTETNAALEFAVNSLEVENILVIGHTCCGGIRALMSMQEEIDSSFIRSWVINGKNARLSTKAAASNLNFDQQCRHCEKESLNRSLLNLLTYPWIKERVSKGLLSIHGGYYDFINCTFEKWTLEYQGTSLKEGGGRHSLRNREFWC